MGAVRVAAVRDELRRLVMDAVSNDEYGCAWTNCRVKGAVDELLAQTRGGRSSDA
jgi:hypothetical protein